MVVFGVTLIFFLAFISLFSGLARERPHWRHRRFRTSEDVSASSVASALHVLFFVALIAGLPLLVATLAFDRYVSPLSIFADATGRALSDPASVTEGTLNPKVRHRNWLMSQGMTSAHASEYQRRLLYAAPVALLLAATLAWGLYRVLRTFLATASQDLTVESRRRRLRSVREQYLLTSGPNR